MHGPGSVESLWFPFVCVFSLVGIGAPEKPTHEIGHAGKNAKKDSNFVVRPYLFGLGVPLIRGYRVASLSLSRAPNIIARGGHFFFFAGGWGGGAVFYFFHRKSDRERPNIWCPRKESRCWACISGRLRFRPDPPCPPTG